MSLPIPMFVLVLPRSIVTLWKTDWPSYALEPFTNKFLRPKEQRSWLINKASPRNWMSAKITMRMHAIDNLMNHVLKKTARAMTYLAWIYQPLGCPDWLRDMRWLVLKSNGINPISKTDMHALLHEMSIYQLYVSIKFDWLKKSLVSRITCTCEWLKIYEEAIVCSTCVLWLYFFILVPLWYMRKFWRDIHLFRDACPQSIKKNKKEKKKVTAHIIQK